MFPLGRQNYSGDVTDKLLAVTTPRSPVQRPPEGGRYLARASSGDSVPL